MPSIRDSSQQLLSEFRLVPHMAAELECYVVLDDESSAVMDAFWLPVSEAFAEEDLAILRIEKERGLHQYEVVTGVMPPLRLAESLRIIRQVIEKQALRAGVQVSFAGKPYADQPSSGLHLHLHLADGAGVNAYQKTEEWTSDALRHSLGGLLAVMADQMPIFFPHIEDYARLNDVDHVPKIFGWGVNNRYCALRIPATPDPYDKRIEHRVPCASADPARAIEAMLTGVLKGLHEKIEPTNQQYGKKGDATVRQLVAG